MKILKLVSDLPENLFAAYIKWYRARYVPERGDLVINLCDLYVTQNVEPYFVMYSSFSTKTIEAGTPMLCVDIKTRQTIEQFYVMRVDDIDVILPERLVIFMKVQSRTRSAIG